MISQNYDFDEFLKFIEDKNYIEIIPLADAECGFAERQSFSVKGAVKARAMGSTSYAKSLKGFLFFLRSGIKPMGIDDYEFAKYKSVCEKLVEKKQFKPEVLQMFQSDRRR
ncbi:MAG: hypothetical protein LUM44_17865 [Pyrinomonadaceae bacterium]|nr:hypothetical protein [Pyrinomonadaceae bacterium]